MATSNCSETITSTEFFLDEEDESDTNSSHVEYCKISSNITARSLVSFLQRLLEIYQPPSNENYILTLAVEAALDDKSALIEVSSKHFAFV